MVGESEISTRLFVTAGGIDIGPQYIFGADAQTSAPLHPPITPNTDGFAEVVFDQDRADRIALRLQMDRASYRQCRRNPTTHLRWKGFRGTPGGTRTPNLLIRSQTDPVPTSTTLSR
jgi:hypothetical protein